MAQPGGAGVPDTTLTTEAAVHTREEDAQLPHEDRLTRMSRTPDDLAAAIRGRNATVLARRPDEKNWAATEVICHLRDIEDVSQTRLESMLLNDELRVYSNPARVERWVVDRQYLRNDAGAALEAFRRLREDTVTFMRQRTPADLARASVHPRAGRMTMGDFISLLAAHDDNHLDQLRRAIEGRA